ncbi:MAG: alpha/beta hydrolase, partial [Clostridiales bacterium]|nr:alpha/beta hydrolase [Clostridiales bacterium]
MKYIEVENNVNIAIEDINPCGRETVLFIHGWPLSGKIFEYQYDILPKYNIRCIYVDLRGFGNSDCTWDGYDYTSLASDIYKVMKNISVKSLTLAGFSMGGAIAVRYMALYKGYKVKKLALLGAATPAFTQKPFFPYGMTKEQVDTLIAQAYHNRPKMTAEFGKMLFASDPSQQLQDWFKLITWKACGIATIKTLKSLRDEELKPDLNKIEVPTGIFHGKLDKVC